VIFHNFEIFQNIESENRLYRHPVYVDRKKVFAVRTLTWIVPILLSRRERWLWSIQVIYVNIVTYVCPSQIMRCHSQFQWVREDVWELERDITTKHQKSGRCSVLEAGSCVFLYVVLFLGITGLCRFW